MIRKFFTVFASVGVLVATFALIGLMGAMRPQPQRKEVEITAPAVFYDITTVGATVLNVNAQGEVRPRTDINLTAQVAGNVTYVSDKFVNGGAFKKGDILMRIEDSTYRARAASAKARLARENEALRREEAEAALAARDYAELGREDEPSDLALRIPQLAQAEANYEAAQADYRATQIELDRTIIRAPFDGRVRERIAGLGQYVSPGTPLGRTFSTDIAEIRLALTDTDLAKLGIPIGFIASNERSGPTAEISASVAGRAHSWNGTITRTDGAIDAATRQVFAVAVVEDPYGAGSDDGVPLAMGLFVDVTIEGRPYEQAVVLPRSALHGRNDVYVITENNTLELRRVDIISASKDTITIGSGLAAGEKVVTSPLRGATNGDEVEPIDRSDSPTGREIDIAKRDGEETQQTDVE